jgi:hypothetical protein
MQKQEICCLPKSLAEAKSMGHNLYFTGVACKHGHTTYRYVKDRACSGCVKAKVKRLSTVGGGNARRWASKTPEQLAEIYAKRKEYYYKTKEARLAEKKASYEKLKQNPDWAAVRRQKNNTRRAEGGRKPETSNPEVKRRYKQTPHGKANTRANEAKRHAAKMHRTPAWLTADDLWMIEQAYDLAALRTKLFGFSWHVDHVLPLQGKKVSGLHVPNNLQVIPWVDNVRKANGFEVLA